MHADQQFTYQLEIQRVRDARRFPAGAIADAFLQLPREQVIFKCRRRGYADSTDPAVHEQPLAAADGHDQISGLTLTAGNENSQSTMTFSLALFAPAVSMAASQLAKQGHLKADDKYLYRVFAQPGKPGPPEDPVAGVVAQVRRTPITFLDGLMSDLLGDAEPIGPTSTDDYPLFVTQQALAMAQTYCRKPGDKEGGVLMLGHLYRQFEPEPEIFGLIDDVIEIRHAEQSPFRLDLTTNAFAYLQTQLDLRRARPDRQHELAMATGHGHNFLPSITEDGTAKCPTCQDRTTCQLTSSFYSQDDTQFHRAYFSRAPWAVGLVWGFTPRYEDDLRVFCLVGAHARQRGYYRLHNTAHQLTVNRRITHAFGKSAEVKHS